MELAVVRALALGDMLCAIPALRSLRARFPDASITLIGLPWARLLVRRFPVYLDAFLEFPGFPGIPEAPAEPGRVLDFLTELQRTRWDLVVQLHGSGTAINELVALSGAARLAGFVPPGMEPPRAEDGDVWVPYPSHGSEVDRLLSLTAALGGPVDRRTEFPITDADLSEASRLLGDGDANRARLAVIHAGGSDPGRRWPVDRFAAVADELARNGFRVVLTGSGDEVAVSARVASLMSAQPIDLAGRTSLGALAGLIEQASVIVTNDTGTSHLAAAVGTDSVTVFSASDRERWEPVGTGRHLGVGRPSFPRTCRHEPATDGTHRCLGDACTLIERRDGPVVQADVPVQDVLDAIHALIDGAPFAPVASMA